MGHPQGKTVRQQNTGAQEAAGGRGGRPGLGRPSLAARNGKDGQLASALTQADRGSLLPLVDTVELIPEKPSFFERTATLGDSQAKNWLLLVCSALSPATSVSLGPWRPRCGLERGPG